MFRPQAIIAAVLAIAVLGYYGWQFYAQPVFVPPEVLAQKALGANTQANREVAAVQLAQVGKPAREQLVRVFGESADPRVRAACVRGLSQQSSYHHMPLLLDALDDESLEVREQAGQVVQLMLRINYEFPADAPIEKRRPIVAKLRKQWERFRNSEKWQEYMRQQEGSQP